MKRTWVAPFSLCTILCAIISTVAIADNDPWEVYRSIRLQTEKKQSEKVYHQPTTQVSTSRLAADAIVYTRVPRTTGNHTVTLSDGSEYTSDQWSFADVLPDVTHQKKGFNGPGQLVLRQDDGTETIIFDCTVLATPCVPLDAMPSLDGGKIAFSVYYASGYSVVWGLPPGLPANKLSGTGEAQIYIYDIASASLTAWPHTAGVYDINPVWMPNGEMVFSSDRDGYTSPFQDRITITDLHKKNFRLYRASADGLNQLDISPHELSGALHPYVHSSGRLLYSSHWLSHNLAYNTTNGGINWPGTGDNMWVVQSTDLNGGDIMANMGAHKSYFTNGNGFDSNVKALHFLGERANGDFCATNYYRANNLGLGSVICAPMQARGVEGNAPHFLPNGHYSVAVWSTSEDSASRKDAEGIYLGKVGYPEGTADNQLLLSVAKGYCTQVSISPTVPTIIGDQIGCDTGIYKTTTIPSQSPDDLDVVVDSPEWHEFAARVVHARTISQPALSTTGDDTCELVSTDAGATDISAFKPYQFNNNYFTAAQNGSEMQGVKHSELAGIRFLEVVPNPTNSVPDVAFKNSIGNEVRLLGDVPLLTDNSFKVQLPCDTPFLMVGIDSQGRAIKRDQTAQSLRAGEKRVCTGCHLHSKKGRPYDRSLAFTAPPLPLLTPSPVPTYTNDIKPIFDARCSGCHSDDIPLFDYKKLAWDVFQQSVPEGKKIQVSDSLNEKVRYGLQRPMTSKYVNSMYARESLLYWKAANRRTDGRSDDTYPNDIDFGADHPTAITAVELKVISDWLDSGAAR